MAIKLKNNHKTRITLSLIGILAVTIISMCFFPMIGDEAHERLRELYQSEEMRQNVDTGLLENIYRGCYELYLEAKASSGQTAADFYLEADYQGQSDEKASYVEDMQDQVNMILSDINYEFEALRSQIDYCIWQEDNEVIKNTNKPLEKLFTGMNSGTEEDLQEYYNAYFLMEFDENGRLTIDPVYTGGTDASILIKTLGQQERENSVWGSLAAEYREMGISSTLKHPSNITIAFGIPANSDYQLTAADDIENAGYWEILSAYRDAGAGLLYAGALALIAGLVLVMTSGKIWKCEIDLHRPGRWYVLEAAVIGIFVSLSMEETFIQSIYSLTGSDTAALGSLLESGMDALPGLLDLFAIGLSVFGMLGIWYLSVRFLRPVFALGMREYVREYSFLYQIFPYVKKHWSKLREETEHIDFSNKSVKTIVKLVILNFIVLAAVSILWFFGIFALVVYSVVLFILLENYYRKIQFHYKALLRGVSRIAEGDLDAEITEDLGVFEPIKGELGKVRTGFKKAVEDEVRSQRMKTELITNVSHDLKTPLTAITTYVELLKKEDITKEERRSYIEILEKKSLRLKVLVEDLFEVSKATSNNITIEKMDVDVVNLLKQVSVEHTDKFAQMELDVRWNVPDEKVILQLDNQKTYRIFENLFVNIQKYAMPCSRVYIDVQKADGCAEIVIRNMSAAELNVRPEELTERFVRGDASRNTEGSGLGLAIAKSFTEAQGGTFSVDVDGDLFKVIIRWKMETKEV